MIASVVGGLSAILVFLLFGGITAAAIVYTTPLYTPVDNKKPMLHSIPIDLSYVSDTHAEMPYVDSKHSQPQGYIAPMKEHFVNGGNAIGSVQPIGSEPLGTIEVDGFPYAGPALPDYTPPTSRNLFMNVLLDEQKYNPGRPESAPVSDPTVKQTMDDYFRVQWFSDPTDVFGKTQGQRQFITQPSTTVPNAQGSFADWLYKIPGKTCKEGGHCMAGSDGSPMPWLNHTS